MQELQKAIARLKFLLADIDERDRQLDDLVKQFQTQSRRAPKQAIYSNLPLDASLGAMAEIEERLHDAETTRQHLQTIRRRAQEKVQALQLTQQVEEAKQELASLQDRVRQTKVHEPNLEAQISKLEQFISENSQRAGRAITSSTEEGDRASA